MRRLLLAAASAVALAVPVTPAAAGPAACVVTSGIPVCAGNCSSGDPITVYVVGTGAPTGTASCGGGEARCTAFRGACSGSGRATGSGSLSCSGPSGAVVVCVVGITATASLVP